MTKNIYFHAGGSSSEFRVFEFDDHSLIAWRDTGENKYNKTSDTIYPYLRVWFSPGSGIKYSRSFTVNENLTATDAYPPEVYSTSIGLALDSANNVIHAYYISGYSLRKKTYNISSGTWSASVPFGTYTRGQYDVVGVNPVGVDDVILVTQPNAPTSDNEYVRLYRQTASSLGLWVIDSVIDISTRDKHQYYRYPYDTLASDAIDLPGVGYLVTYKMANTTRYVILGYSGYVSDPMSFHNIRWDDYVQVIITGLNLDKSPDGKWRVYGVAYFRLFSDTGDIVYYTICHTEDGVMWATPSYGYLYSSSSITPSFLKPSITTNPYGQGMVRAASEDVVYRVPCSRMLEPNWSPISPSYDMSERTLSYSLTAAVSTVSQARIDISNMYYLDGPYFDKSTAESRDMAISILENGNLMYPGLWMMRDYTETISGDGSSISVMVRGLQTVMSDTAFQYDVTFESPGLYNEFASGSTSPLTGKIIRSGTFSAALASDGWTVYLNSSSWESLDSFSALLSAKTVGESYVVEADVYIDPYYKAEMIGAGIVVGASGDSPGYAVGIFQARDNSNQWLFGILNSDQYQPVDVTSIVTTGWYRFTAIVRGRSLTAYVRTVGSPIDSSQTRSFSACLRYSSTNLCGVWGSYHMYYTPYDIQKGATSFTSISSYGTPPSAIMKWVTQDYRTIDVDRNATNNNTLCSAMPAYYPAMTRFSVYREYDTLVRFRALRIAEIKPSYTSGSVSAAIIRMSGLSSTMCDRLIASGFDFLPRSTGSYSDVTYLMVIPDTQYYKISVNYSGMASGNAIRFATDATSTGQILASHFIVIYTNKVELYDLANGSYTLVDDFMLPYTLPGSGIIDVSISPDGICVYAFNKMVAAFPLGSNWKKGDYFGWAASTGVTLTPHLDSLCDYVDAYSVDSGSDLMSSMFRLLDSHGGWFYDVDYDTILVARFGMLNNTGSIPTKSLDIRGTSSDLSSLLSIIYTTSPDEQYTAVKLYGGEAVSYYIDPSATTLRWDNIQRPNSLSSRDVYSSARASVQRAISYSCGIVLGMPLSVFTENQAYRVGGVVYITASEYSGYSGTYVVTRVDISFNGEDQYGEALVYLVRKPS